MSEGGHDDLELSEILRRLEAAERLVREAREMLDARAGEPREAVSHGPLFESKAAAGASATPAPAAPPPEPAALISDLDPALLARHSPPGPEEAYQSAITALFRLALDEASHGEAAELLARLMHGDAVRGERALESLMAFSWRRFVKQHGVYLATPEAPASFSVAHTRPRDPQGADQLKAYLQAPRRSPVPVELARDQAAGGAWRLVAFSL